MHTHTKPLPYTPKPIHAATYTQPHTHKTHNPTHTEGERHTNNHNHTYLTNRLPHIFLEGQIELQGALGNNPVCTIEPGDDPGSTSLTHKHNTGKKKKFK